MNMNVYIAWAHAFNACNSINTVLMVPYFRRTMSYQFINKDQLTTFLCSLQDLLSSKHEIVKENLPARIPIIMSDGLVEEVTREKLELRCRVQCLNDGFLSRKTSKRRTKIRIRVQHWES